MMWAAWMLRLGLAASTASTYLSLARSSMEIALGYKLTNVDQTVRLPRVMRRLRKMYKCVRRKRLGWRAHHARLLRQKRGTPAGPMGTTVHALLSTAREGLARCCELGPSTVRGKMRGRAPRHRHREERERESWGWGAVREAHSDSGYEPIPRRHHRVHGQRGHRFPGALPPVGFHDSHALCLRAPGVAARSP